MISRSRFLSAFDSFERQVSKKDPAWLRQLRKNAISQFQDAGLPTFQNENWKYTNVAPIVDLAPEFTIADSAKNISHLELEPFTFGQKDWHELIFINGVFSKELSKIDSDSKVKITNLKSNFLSEPEILEKYLAHVAAYQENAFAALNTAFINDGAFIHVPEGIVLNKPIHLIFVSFTQNGPLISQPRSLILAGKNSKVTVIESYISLCGGAYFTNAVTEIFAGEGASVEYHKLQRESERAFHIGTTQVRQETGSHFSSYAIDLGGKLARNNLIVDLAAEKAECELNGLYLVSGEQHTDNTTLINHPKTHGTSRQLYKGLVSGKGRAVFFGKIFVHPKAEYTDASQTNKNLLLSESATVDTRPQLEILNDNVKCVHGAAVGQLDEHAIFYLKTRGIGEREAQRLLAYGFAREVLDRVRLVPIKKELDRLLLARLQDCSYFAWRDRRKEHE